LIQPMLMAQRKSFSGARRPARLWPLAAFLSAGLWPLLAGAAAARPPQAASSPTTLQCIEIPSAILGRSVSTCVDLPPDYDTAAGTRYPVLYFLHGLFENARSWSERGGQQILDGLIRDGEVGKFIVVMPDGGRSFYVNSKDGTDRYEDFFIQELVPAIDKKYRTIPDVNLRGISGVSMGGYGSLHLGMRHADVFGSASAQSAALLPKFPNPLPTEGRWGFYARVLEGPFGNPLSEAYWEQNSPLTLAEHPENFKGLKLYFDCGDQDRYGFNEGNGLLDKILTEHGFPHEYHLRSGGHGWSYLNQYMKYALLFHWHIWAPLVAKSTKP
jgi:putative tributyrin esterase